ncbi:hypothetical protein GCM10011405_30850 [Rufibacter glacialis]|nr:hypothetical protein GCM10011405_30850 [Rufibacter glacialis]
MILIPHRFRPPKRTDYKRWKTVGFFIDNGFKYQHIYKYTDLNIKLLTENVEYPETLKEAKEFVETFKAQSYKSKKSSLPKMHKRHPSADDLAR